MWTIVFQVEKNQMLVSLISSFVFFLFFFRHAAKLLTLGIFGLAFWVCQLTHPFTQALVDDAAAAAEDKEDNVVLSKGVVVGFKEDGVLLPKSKRCFPSPSVLGFLYNTIKYCCIVSYASMLYILLSIVVLFLMLACCTYCSTAWL
jgi:hypothetical protein